MLFFHQADVAQGKTFFDEYWPEARAVSDPEKTFYAAFGRRQGGLTDFVGPGAFAASLRALAKGNFVGIPAGDVRTMPGFFGLRKNGEVVWEYDSKHAGDHPDFLKIPEYLG